MRAFVEDKGYSSNVASAIFFAQSQNIPILNYNGGRLDAYLCLHDHNGNEYSEFDSGATHADTIHEINCSICNCRMGTENHIFEVNPDDVATNEVHYLRCEKCGFERTQGQAHDYTYVGKANISTHIGICSICGYTCTERHTWVSYPTYMKCSKCGVKTTNVAIPDAHIPDEETE